MKILDKINQYRIILGSQSPRRHALLSGLGINFEIITCADQDETYPEGLKKEEIPVYLAKQKSNLLMDQLSADTILITADTIVWINNEVLGKPLNHDEAIEILKKISGRMHEVHTGVCLKSLRKEVLFSVKSEVFFRNLYEDEIEYYISRYKPYDKAGAYGVQEWIGYIGIEKINGSYYNVMGLPTQRLFNELQKFVT